MTTEEATKIFEIMSTADGDCSCCVADLCAQFIEAFPEHKVLIDSLHDVWWKDHTYDGHMGKERPKT